MDGADPYVWYEEGRENVSIVREESNINEYGSNISRIRDHSRMPDDSELKIDDLYKDRNLHLSRTAPLRCFHHNAIFRQMHRSTSIQSDHPNLTSLQ
jgi:hypothetical protein